MTGLRPTPFKARRTHCLEHQKRTERRPAIQWTRLRVGPEHSPAITCSSNEHIFRVLSTALVHCHQRDSTSTASPARAPSPPSRRASVIDLPKPTGVDTKCLTLPHPVSAHSSLRKQAFRRPAKAKARNDVPRMSVCPTRPIDSGSDHPLGTCQNSNYAEAIHAQAQEPSHHARGQKSWPRRPR